MELHFSKYQGTGNDFVMIDNRAGLWSDLTIANIRQLCDRRFGIGADGLIKINTSNIAAFEVDYYNADGSKSFCGNGARCAVAFANKLGINTGKVVFDAIDGIHQADLQDGIVALNMSPVNEVLILNNAYSLNTGSPHYIQYVDAIETLNIIELGKNIRYSNEYEEVGINVNAIQEISAQELIIRTYERGVEDETLSCGTGVTAAALAHVYKHELYGEQHIQVKTMGGNLSVKLNRTGDQQFTDIVLIGPATHVFDGITAVGV